MIKNTEISCRGKCPNEPCSSFVATTVQTPNIFTRRAAGHRGSAATRLNKQARINTLWRLKPMRPLDDDDDDAVKCMVE